MPWKAISTLISSNFHGGKIDNHYDFLILDSMCKRLFQPNCTEVFEGSPPLPSQMNFDAFVKYIDDLPEESPVFLNLQASIADLQKI